MEGAATQVSNNSDVIYLLMIGTMVIAMVVVFLGKGAALRFVAACVTLSALVTILWLAGGGA